MQKFQYVFLDSGAGGVPYFNYLMEIAPESSCVYVADSKHFPYGTKTSEEVVQFSLKITSQIIKTFEPSVIVIACNTMSVSALKELREEFKIPFIGTVPAIKQGVLKSKTRRIGILATERTVNDIYTQNLMEEFGKDCIFFMRADTFLIQYIENSFLSLDEEKNLQAVAPALDFFKSVNVDTIVLACTHFLNLRETFIKAAAPDIQIADSLEGVVRQTLKISPPKKSLEQNAFFITSPNKSSTAEIYRKYAEKMDLSFGILQEEY